MSDPPDFVLFDLGGVLVELRGVPAMSELSGIDDELELWRKWLDCRWVRTFEAGRCGPDAFARGVVDDWDLPVGPDEFLKIFTSWPVGPLAGAEDLVRLTAANVAVGCFSNTNAVHWDGNAERWPLMEQFEFRFLSHRMGLVKPDAEAFDQAVDALPTPPSRVLYLDDNAVNVDAARSVGMRAEHVNGVDEARLAIEAAGLP